MTRVLVTGASGLLGLSLCRDLADRHEVVAVSHTRPVVHPGVRGVAVDLRDPESLRRLFDSEHPSLVVHAAALTSIEACEADPALARELNTDLAVRVAHLCAEHGSRLVHVSTDAVFDGAGGPYRESDPVAPGSVYAQSKADAETGCLAALPGALVARVNFFGWSATGRRSLAEFFHRALSAGERVRGFTDVTFSPLYQRDLGTLLLDAADAGIAGIRHAGGPDVLSKFEFGRLVAEVFDLDPDLVEPSSVAVLQAGQVRSPRLAMDSGLLAGELGRELPSVRAGLTRMRRDLDDGWAGSLKAMVPAPPVPDDAAR